MYEERISLTMRKQKLGNANVLKKLKRHSKLFKTRKINPTLLLFTECHFMVPSTDAHIFLSAKWQEEYRLPKHAIHICGRPIRATTPYDITYMVSIV